MNLRIIGLTALALASLSACSEPAAVKAKAEIFAADRAFNARSQKDGPKAAFQAFVAADGKLLSESTAGAEAIRITFGKLPDTATLSWETAFVDASSSGDLGYTWGNYVLTIPLPNYGPKPVVRRGTYVTIWKRQPTGDWKVVLDGGSPERER